MRNDGFYEHRRFSKKKSKDTVKKSDLFPVNKKEYSLGNLLSDVGNQGIQNFLVSGLVQSKLNVSQPGDMYEKEADRIAKSIIHNNNSDINGSVNVSKVQAKLNAEDLSMDSTTESKINGLKGKGSPLSKSVKDYFEPRFGVDLGNVRVHNNNNANQLAKSINAKAFTYGNDIAFGAGQYQPETTAGKELIAHELTHTLQQGRGVQRDVVQRDERQFDYHTQSYIKTSAEYAREVINKMQEMYDYNTGVQERYTYTQIAVAGIQIIINLEIDKIMEILTIIHDENSFLFNILKTNSYSTSFEVYQMDIIDVCTHSIENNSTDEVDIIKFREDAITETSMMLLETEAVIDREIIEYKEDDSKLTALAELIKNEYGVMYEDADKLRADELINFYNNFNMDDLLSPCALGYGPPNIANIGTFLSVYERNKDTAAVTEYLRGVSPGAARRAMTSYLEEKNIVSSNAADEYINEHYPNILKADYDDILATQLLHIEHADEYGFLTDIHTDFRGLSNKSIDDIKTEIINILNQRKNNARNTRENINDNHTLIWELKPLIELLMYEKNISPDSHMGRLINESVRAREQFKIFRSIALGVIGLAIGIAGFFTAGTAWAAFPIIAGLALSSLDLIIEINDYSFNAAASQSMYDFALSMDPSAVGIAFAILGLVFDVVDVISYSGKLISEAAERIARATAENIDEVLEAEYRMLRSSGKLSDDVELDDFIAATQKASSQTGQLSKRLQYMGRTPGKNSRTGREVIERMRADGLVKDDPVLGTIFQDGEGVWRPIDQADMAHVEDAVTWWNSTGRYYGAKSQRVRDWMLDSNNYYLEYFAINRSQGTLLRASGVTYLPPVN